MKSMMNATENFTFRISPLERAQLSELAWRLRRSQGATIKILVSSMLAVLREQEAQAVNLPALDPQGVTDAAQVDVPMALNYTHFANFATQIGVFKQKKRVEQAKSALGKLQLRKAKLLRAIDFVDCQLTQANAELEKENAVFEKLLCTPKE